MKIFGGDRTSPIYFQMIQEKKCLHNVLRVFKIVSKF